MLFWEIFFINEENYNKVRLPFFLSKSLKTFHNVSLFFVIILYNFSKQFFIFVLDSFDSLLKL